MTAFRRHWRAVGGMALTWLLASDDRNTSVKVGGGVDGGVGLS